MYELYSQRIKNSSGEPEVFTYDKFPQEFRNQLFHIISKTCALVKKWNSINVETYIELLCSSFAYEKGIKYIKPKSGYPQNTFITLEQFIDVCEETDIIDLIDFVYGNFNTVEVLQKNAVLGCYHLVQDINDEIITELNLRFKQHGIGYALINGQVIKKTNTLAHEKIIKPVLRLLLDENFRGAEEEYLAAFDSYKKLDNKNAILNATKAFESTLKTICTGMKYDFDHHKDTVSKLISILEHNEFYPSYLNSHLTSIRTSLESGAPTVRNKTSGHGQGGDIVEVPDYYVEYVLNLVATNIIFLHKIYIEKIKGGV